MHRRHTAVMYMLHQIQHTCLPSLASLPNFSSPTNHSQQNSTTQSQTTSSSLSGENMCASARQITTSSNHKPKPHSPKSQAVQASPAPPNSRSAFPTLPISSQQIQVLWVAGRHHRDLKPRRCISNRKAISSIWRSILRRLCRVGGECRWRGELGSHSGLREQNGMSMSCRA